MQPSGPEHAAAAAAAAWLIVGEADTATVLLYDSATHSFRASGRRRDDGELDIRVDSDSGSVTDLLAPEHLFPNSAPATTNETFVWPERLAASCVNSATGRTPEHARLTAARILDQATSQHTIVPDVEHLEAMAEFAAGAGHEINNPLGSIIGQAQLLLKQEQQIDRRQSLSTIGAQAWRIRDMIGDSMLFARPPEPDFQQSDLSPLLRESAGAAAEALDLSDNCIRFQLPETPATAEVDVTQIRTLISHLVRNSLEACLNAELEPQVTLQLSSRSDAVLIVVEDRGPGITDEPIRRHLFDPFFSGRQAGRGIGFGLPVCWQITRRHAGLILQETPVGGGSRMVVALPVAQTPGVAGR